MEPLPEYFGEWQQARWIGVTRDDLEQMPVHEVEEARVVMLALARAERDAHEQASRKGGKR